PLFEYLGLRQSFHAQGWLPSTGVESSWGNPGTLRREAIFTAQGPGWHIDRHRFDQWLRREAIDHGTEWRRTRLTGAHRLDDGWDLQLEDGHVRCRIAVDATGRGARFARLAGARRLASDTLMGTLWWFQGEARAQAEGTLLESTPEGWWYSAHLPDARVVAGFLTDADLLPAWLREGDLATGLRGAPRTAVRLDGTRLQSGPTTRNASTTRTEPAADTGWLTAGDAAIALDPLSSLGIGHALLSGIEAARAAAVACLGQVEVFPAFAEAARLLFAQLRERQIALYRAERRWPEAPFWARRHQAAVEPFPTPPPPSQAAAKATTPAPSPP
ncbi:MAG: tryptophan 7-halogenase, partial [Verrucomicrobiales bacterium]|nr:tryptophan 7-halogenase [Verrucomicrobiales bacterium]